MVIASSESSQKYVKVDYEGEDRVGFKIDTTSMADTHQIESFYLVTEWIQGNNKEHVPLGYDNLAANKRFFTKQNNGTNYLVGNPSDSKSGITLNDQDRHKTTNFSIPKSDNLAKSIHLISATNLGISKADLNGNLGTFPTSAAQGGEQRVRELILLSNNLTSLEHSNIVRYLIEKWNIAIQTVFTNYWSSYAHADSDIIEHALDGNKNTTFTLSNSWQNTFNSGTVLFEYRITGGSVLEPFAFHAANRGLYSLLLRTGYKNGSRTLLSSAQVDVLRVGNNWSRVRYFPQHTTAGHREFRFYLGTDNVIGYRLVVASTKGSTSGWLEINDFALSTVSANSPQILAFDNTLSNNKIYDTNSLVFSYGFTNHLLFNQQVYGLEASDFQVSNGVIHSLIQNNPSNYNVVIKPFSFESNSVQQHQFLTLHLPELAATNVSGDGNHPIRNTITFVIFNPLSGFDAGGKSTPSFGDIDADGDMDMVSGENNGRFWFYSNNGNGTFTEYSNTHAANPFNGLSVAVGDSKPSLADIDKDGDLDMVSGEYWGGFWFYSNNGNGTFTQYAKNHSANPFNGLNVGIEYSAPSLGDIDGDGDMDMVSGVGNGRFWFYSNNGNGSYTTYSHNHAANPFKDFNLRSFSSPAFEDIDGDEDLDMISGKRYGEFWFYSNNGNGSYTAYSSTNSANPFKDFDVGDYSSPAFGDIDGDGDLDMISGEGGGKFKYFKRFGDVFLESKE